MESCILVDLLMRKNGFHIEHPNNKIQYNSKIGTISDFNNQTSINTYSTIITNNIYLAKF